VWVSPLFKQYMCGLSNVWVMGRGVGGLFVGFKISETPPLLPPPSLPRIR